MNPTVAGCQPAVTRSNRAYTDFLEPSLLTTEIKKSRKRFSRISKTKGSEESIIVSEPTVKDIYPTGRLIHPSARDNQVGTQPVPAENRGLSVDSFSSVSATDWAAADEEPLVN